MTNECGDAEEGLFTLDPEDQAAVEKTFGAEGGATEVEEQAQAQEHEQGQAGQGGPAADRPKVRMFSLSFHSNTSPPHPFPRC
jgi:hypothetical protein